MQASIWALITVMLHCFMIAAATAWTCSCRELFAEALIIDSLALAKHHALYWLTRQWWCIAATSPLVQA